MNFERISLVHFNQHEVSRYIVDQFSVLPRIFLRSSGEWGGGAGVRARRLEKC